MMELFSKRSGNDDNNNNDIGLRIIRATCTQLKNNIRLGHLHASKRKHESEANASEWWDRQVHKWESIWETINKSTRDLTRFQNSQVLEFLINSIFIEYDQLNTESMRLDVCIESEDLKDEAKKWRSVGIYIAMLQKQCMINNMTEDTSID